MEKITINDSISEIKGIIETNINSILQGRSLDELTNEELLTLHTSLKEYNDVLDDKLSLQKEELDNLKSKIRSNIDSLSASNN